MGENLVDMSQITKMGRISNDFSQFGDYYMFSRINRRVSGENVMFDVSMPMRFGGLMFVLCLDGSISVDINLHSYEIKPNSVVITGPDTVVKVNGIDAENLDVYTLFLSHDFIRDISIDMTTLTPRILSRRNNTPILSISNEEMNLLKRYFELLHHNTTANTDDKYIKNISRCLVACISYQIMQFAEQRIGNAEIEDSPNVSRRMNYVREFIELVHAYHRTERTVGFYAGKLFISPKYLSLIVKEATGRSAAEWIDEYVILEAKNMLRFSGKNIQQVAYELNFTSQSSFGKYFKHLTGMSPSEFIKT